MRLFMFVAALINPAVLALPGGLGGPPPQGLKEPRMFDTAEIENSMEPAKFYADNQQQTLSGDDTCNAASNCPAPQKYACDGTKCICWDFCSDFSCPFVKPGDEAVLERCGAIKKSDPNRAYYAGCVHRTNPIEEKPPGLDEVQHQDRPDKPIDDYGLTLYGCGSVPCPR